MAETDTDAGPTQLLSISGTLIKLLKPPEWIISNRLWEPCSDSPASPLWFDKIVLATTSQRLRLQTATQCPGNCRGGARQADKFVSDQTSRSIYL